MILDSKVYFKGLTVEQEINLIELKNTAKANDPNSKNMVIAMTTLGQPRDYEQIEKTKDGQTVYEADGTTPKKKTMFDNITLKFRNSQAESFKRCKPAGVRRKIHGWGHLETYREETDIILVNNPTTGKIDKIRVSDGRGGAIKHIVDHVMIVVEQYEFLDPQPESLKAAPVVGTAYVTANIPESVQASAPAAGTVMNENLLPFEPTDDEVPAMPEM